MQRIIKFRVWDGKKFSYASEIGYKLLEIPGSLEFRFKDNNKPIFEPEKLRIQQFTGLQDKNGKDIYEGDIIKETLEKGPNLPERFKDYIKDNEKQHIEEIKWDNYVDGEYVDKIECWMYGDRNSISELISRTRGTYHEYIRTYEIIGNTFENPELLEK